MTHQYRPLPDSPPQAPSNDTGIFGDTGNSGGTFNMFRPQALSVNAPAAKHHAAEGSRHQHGGRHQPDRAQSVWPDFRLTGDTSYSRQPNNYWGAQSAYPRYPQETDQPETDHWAYFKNRGHKHGHSGVVFVGENGELMVANNRGGITIAKPLSAMMLKYGSGSVRGLRADI